MVGSRSENVAPRLQFRLSLAVPEEAALYEELRTLPTGKRNATIVRLLLAGKATKRPAEEKIEEILHRVLREYMGGGLNAAPAEIQAEAIPDDCFDTSLFD